MKCGWLSALFLLSACEKAPPAPEPPKAPVRAEPLQKPEEPRAPQVPAPVAATPPSEIELMEALSDRKFKEAKQAYENKNLFDAVEIAEEARRIVSALASLYESKGLSHKVNEVSERVRHITEFIVLCRKTTPPPVAAPPPPPPAVAPPSPEPAAPVPVVEHKEFESLWASFVDILRQFKIDRPIKSEEFIVRARKVSRLEADARRGMLQVSILILTALGRQEWVSSPEEAGLLNAYAARFPKYGMDAEAYSFLVEGVSRITRVRCPIVRALIFAHLSGLKQQAPVDTLLDRHRAILELCDDGMSMEGDAIQSIREALKGPAPGFLQATQKCDGVREPLLRTYRILQLLLAVSAFDVDESPGVLAAALSELGRSAPYPSLKPHLDEWKAILTTFKPCKWCGGTNRVPCDYRCQQGVVTKMCMVCSGTGKKPGYGDTRPCPEQYTHPHTWTEDCPRCKGTSHLPCRSCKAPWQRPAETKVAASKSCELCGASGFLTSFLLICPDCHGIGATLSPPKKK